MKLGWLGYVLLLCSSWSAHAAEESTPSLFERADLAWKERRDEDAKLAFDALFAADPNHRLGHESFQYWQWGVAGDQAVLSLYQQRVKKDPSPINHYLLGRLPSEAKERAFHLKSAVEKDPSNTAFAKKWGIFLFRQGRFDEALGALDTLPTDDDVLSATLGSLRLQKKLAAAEQRFVDPALNDTDSFWKQWTAFSYYHAIDRPSQGQPFFERCSALESDSLLILPFDFWNSLPEGHAEKSKAILTTIQEQDPWGQGKRLAPMLPMLIDKDLHASIELWEECIRVMPFAMQGYARLGGLCAQVSQFERSEKALRMALLLHPASPSVMEDLGISFALQERYSKAKEMFSKAIQLERTPDRVKNLGKALLALGQIAEAKRVLAEASELLKNSDDGDSHVLLFNTEEGGFQIDEPSNSRPNVLYALGREQARQGDLKAALATFKEYVALSPKRPLGHGMLSLLYLKGFRDLDKALEHAQRAFTLSKEGQLAHPILATHARNLAMIEYARSQDANCIALLEESQRLSPNLRTERLLHRLQTTEESTPFVLDDVRINGCSEENYCLPLALNAVLDRWDIPNTVAEVGKNLTESLEGMSTPGVSRLLKSKGDQVAYRSFSPDEDVLKQLIRDGYPVIVVKIKFDSEKFNGHATVVNGFDDRLGAFLIEDSNWFHESGMNTIIPYDELPECQAMLIAPPKALAKVQELPDQAFHQHLEEGWRLHLHGKANEAVPQLKKAIETNPKRMLGHLFHALVLEAIDDTYGAERAYERAAELSIYSAAAATRLASCAEDSYGRAKWLEQAVLLEPRSFSIQLALAIALFENNDWLGAAKRAEIATSMKPFHLEANQLLAYCYKESKQFEKALPAAQRAAEIGNRFKDHCNHGILLELLGRIDDSCVALAKAKMLIKTEDERKFWQKAAKGLPVN